MIFHHVEEIWDILFYSHYAMEMTPLNAFFKNVVYQGEGVKTTHLPNELAKYYCCPLCIANFMSSFGR